MEIPNRRTMVARATTNKSRSTLTDHFSRQEKLDLNNANNRSSNRNEDDDDDANTQVTEDSTTFSQGSLCSTFSRSLYYAPTSTHRRRRTGNNLRRLHSSASSSMGIDQSDVDQSSTCNDHHHLVDLLSESEMETGGDNNGAVVNVNYEDMEAIAIGKSAFDEEKEMELAIQAAIEARELIQRQHEEQNSFVKKRVGTFTRNMDALVSHGDQLRDQMLTTIQEEREALPSSSVLGNLQDQMLSEQQEETSPSVTGFLQNKVGIFSRNMQTISSIMWGNRDQEQQQNIQEE